MKAKKFWKDKKVLVVGHTSFHGSWLIIWLLEMGAKVVGYGLATDNEEDNYALCKLDEKIKSYIGNVNDKEAINKVFEEEKPEIVIDLSTLMCNDKSSMDIYENRIMGTLNILNCIKNSSETKVGIIVNSDDCYEAKEQLWGYRENDTLGGYNPYSASQACSELIIASYRHTYLNMDNYSEHGKAIANIRVGKVIGGGDWSEDSIIASCAKAFVNKDPAVIKCSNNMMPIQHVLEPIRGIIMLVEKMYENPEEYSETWNFGCEYSSCMPSLEAAEKFKKEFRKCEILELDDNSEDYDNITKILDITKAKYKLGWAPKWTMDKTISYTADWYKNYKTKDVYSICKNHIEKYSLM